MGSLFSKRKEKEKRRKEREEQSLTFVLFRLQGILNYFTLCTWLGVSTQGATNFEFLKTSMCSQELKTSIVGPQ